MRLCWNTLLTVVMICCCTAAEAAERTRQRPLLEDVSWQSAQKRSRKQCQAKNPNCSLERGTSILSGTVQGLDCDICCSEQGFCRECKCILCCQVISPDPDVSTFFRCMHRPSGFDGSCILFSSFLVCIFLCFITIALIELIVLYGLYGIKDFDHCS
jgi:hypothetical protein